LILRSSLIAAPQITARVHVADGMRRQSSRPSPDFVQQPLRVELWPGWRLATVPWPEIASAKHWFY